MIGVSFHIDLIGCSKLPNGRELRLFVEQAVRDAGMRTAQDWVIQETFPCPEWMDDNGASCLALIIPLRESSVTVHTWPEKDGLVCIDFFTCGSTRRAQEAVMSLAEQFEPKKILFFSQLYRGVTEDAHNAH